MFKTFIEVAEQNICIVSDTKLLNLKNIDFFKIRDKKINIDALIYIKSFKPDSFNSPDLSENEKKLILKTIDFPKKWLKSPIFKFSPFRYAVKKSLRSPEMTQILLNWNRPFIKDFSKNLFYLFYAEENRYKFTDPIFIAGFRNIVGDTFPKNLRIMIHGAAIKRNKKAYIFLAPDGGGKSTITKILAEQNILSDDQIVLEKIKDKIVVHGTPFGEITNGKLKAELGAFFLLEKSESLSLNPVQPQEIMKFIWNEQLAKWFHYPKKYRVRIFDILNFASHAVPAYHLKFPKNFNDWELINKKLTSV